MDSIQTNSIIELLALGFIAEEVGFNAISKYNENITQDNVQALIVTLAEKIDEEFKSNVNLKMTSEVIMYLFNKYGILYE